MTEQTTLTEALRNDEALANETLAQTVERLLPHIDPAGKGAVVVEQFLTALSRHAGYEMAGKERASEIRALVADGPTRNIGVLARALDGIARSWELDDPQCQALALADAQVWATLHLAEVTAGPRLPELTDKERQVLTDAIWSVSRDRNNTGKRVSLLRSASEKLGLEQERPSVADPAWSAVPAEHKIELLKSMGFTPIGSDHQPDCPYAIDAGNRCNCVPDPTMWSPPQDVQEFMHETYEERRTAKRKAIPEVER